MFYVGPQLALAQAELLDLEDDNCKATALTLITAETKTAPSRKLSEASEVGTSRAAGPTVELIGEVQPDASHSLRSFSTFPSPEEASFEEKESSQNGTAARDGGRSPLEVNAGVLSPEGRELERRAVELERLRQQAEAAKVARAKHF